MLRDAVVNEGKSLMTQCPPHIIPTKMLIMKLQNGLGKVGTNPKLKQKKNYLGL